MGTYLNEGAELYRMSVNSEIHVDKSLLIRETNGRVGTNPGYKHHTCVIERFAKNHKFSQGESADRKGSS